MIDASLTEINRAKTALETGDKARARGILITYLKKEPRHIQAWRLLAQSVEKKEETIYCLEWVLRLNPKDSEAHNALLILKKPPRGEISSTKVSVVPAFTEVVKPSSYKPTSNAVVLPQNKFSTSRQSLDQTATTDLAIQMSVPRKKVNWSMLFGLFLVTVVVILAIAGPSIAPRDPMEEHIIIQIEGKWYVPPFEPMTPGFLLGSDEFGRDLFSRVLWGIRPTITMVSIVALARLLLGVILGLISGWASGRLARSLEIIMQTALAIPVFLVALGTIAIIGVEWGIWAFIIGLCLTGWVESAQQVREQTRIIKGQAFIEAAQALGASPSQLLIHHILKQITAMIAMLFAFELSSTLLTSAGLGFLGYYIGGDVWVTVDDFVAQRVSGMPELGQMLATSWVTLTRPSAMVVVGTLIFMAVLGFNLVGEGLRRRMNLVIIRRRGLLSKASELADLWLNENIWHPISTITRRRGVKIGFVGFLALILLGFTIPRFSQWISTFTQPIGLPQSTALSTGIASHSSNQILTSSPESISQGVQPGVLWYFESPGAIEAGPIIAPDGTVFFISGDNQIYILESDGSLRAKAQLKDHPFKYQEYSFENPVAFMPALMPDGTLLVVTEKPSVIAVDSQANLLWERNLDFTPGDFPREDEAGNLYLVDVNAALYVFDSQGLLWKFQSEAAPYTARGLAISPSGEVYFVVTNHSRGFVQAISSQGKGLWATQAKTDKIYDELFVSPDGALVMLADDIFDAYTGEPIPTQTNLRVDEYVIGEDGHTYLRHMHTVQEWHIGQNGFEILNTVNVGGGELVSRPPNEVAVDRNGIVWFFYQGEIVWLSPQEKVVGTHNYNLKPGTFHSIDLEKTRLTNCQQFYKEEILECSTYALGYKEPIWQVKVQGVPAFEFGFLEGEHAYLLTRDKRLIKLYLGNPVGD